MRRALLVAIVALGTAACVPTLDDPAVVKTTRILAVRASPPEAAPGDTVRLDALVVDTSSTLRHTWSLCTPDPVAGLGSCTDPAHLLTLSTAAAPEIVIPANALDSLPASQRAQGIEVFLALSVEESDGSAIERPFAFRSVRVSENPSPNENPAIDWVTVGGSQHEIEVLPDSWVTIEAKALAGSKQTWTDIPTGVAVEETLRFHWFVSDGEIGDSVTEPDPVTNLASTVWHHKGSGTPHVWVVLYDSRGGLDWWAR